MARINGGSGACQASAYLSSAFNQSVNFPHGDTTAGSTFFE